MVLAADCVFWPSLFEPLAYTLRALLEQAGAADEDEDEDGNPESEDVDPGTAVALLSLENRVGRVRDPILSPRVLASTSTPR